MTITKSKNKETITHNPIFPTYKEIMLDILNNSISNKNPGGMGFNSEALTKRLMTLDVVKESIHNFHPTQIIRTLAISAENPIKSDSYGEIEQNFKKSCIAKNQFYTIYDIKSGWHKDIDQNIKIALGLKPSDFSMLAMAGLDEQNPLYHPDDLNHMIRWASLAYMIFAFPGFSWDSMKDYYYVSYRVGTKKSSIVGLRKSKYVVLEKRCFPIFCKDSDELLKPVYHFDQWSVLDASNFDYVKPRWITSSEQSFKVNGLFYLFNAYLMDIPMKHLLMLHYKMDNDRNKMAADQMNKDIYTHSGLQTDFDEIQFGNAFTKTILQKVEYTYNLWDKRNAQNAVTVKSYSSAIHYCRALGLLPIPSGILENILKLVTP